jgi:hypothetical protein
MDRFSRIVLGYHGKVGKSMRDDEMIEQVRKKLQHFKEQPRELWDALIREGIIDAEGKVLVRMPEPPPRPKKNRKKDDKPSGRNHEPH